MKRKLWIVAAAAAVLLLMFGVYRATRPASALMTAEQAQTRLEDSAARFTAAIENGRDVRPLLDDVKLVVDQHPELRAGHTLLGQLHTHLGETESAYAQFAAALNLDPNDAALQNLAGTAAMMIGETNLALTHHQAAAQFDQNDPDLLLPWADVLMKTGQWEDARIVLLRALRIEFTLHEANAGLSDVYAGRGEEGDLQLAIEHMETARAQVKNDPEGLEDEIVYVRKLARLYAQQDEAMEAIRVLGSLMPEEGRGRPGVLAELAGYFAANGQPVSAALEYQFASDAQPDNADYAAEAARWFIEGGKPEPARVMLDRLRGIDSDDPAVQELRAALEELSAR